VAVVKKILGEKAGHTGTLDPMATGVLPVCVGKATKTADLLQAGEKEYVAVIRLGVTTDTEDITGNVVWSAEPEIDYDLFERAVVSFAGGYEQVPPMYSAVKQNGRRLYKIARDGQTVSRPARPVVINNIEILDFNKPEARIKVNCMKGTYIRTLIADIGAVLGCGACMAALVRTKSGPFTMEDAVTLDALKDYVKNGDTARFLIPVDNALHYAKLTVRPEYGLLLRNGNKLPYNAVDGDVPDDENVFMYDGNVLCGVYKPDGGFFRPVAMLV